MQDIAQALSNSLSRDGVGAMRAPLDMGGFKVQNTAPGTGPSDLATLGQAASPIGAVFDFAGSVVPNGYLLCYGQAVSRTDYAALYAVLGVVWGSGDGTTTFNLPDLRGRVSAGKDDMGGTAAARLDSVLTGSQLGAVGGEQKHTLTTPEMPYHSHPVNDPGHSHNYTAVSGSGGIGSGQAFGQSSQNTSISGTGITLASVGGDGAHNNVQPTAVLNKIIKAAL